MDNQKVTWNIGHMKQNEINQNKKHTTANQKDEQQVLALF
jgi:hypothetical protein